jgi:DNA-binding MarR family transcriptional regulator
VPEPITDVADIEAIADTIDRMLLWARRRGPTHMSATSVTTLDTLEQDGPLRISDLAARNGVSQPAMTTLATRLSEEGLAERFPDPTDGRATLLRITPAGQQALRDRHAQRSEALLVDIRQLSQAHQRDLAAAREALEHLCRTNKGSQV